MVASCLPNLPLHPLSPEDVPNEYKHDPVAAISEAEATGETAAMFAEIRKTTQIPLLTSIWRILAGVDEGLAPVWQASKPIYESGQAIAALQKMIAQVDLPVPSLPASQLIKRANFSAKELLQIKAIIDVYNRSNGLNFLGLSAITYESSRSYKAYPVPVDAPSYPQLPALLGQHDMSQATWDFLHKINEFGASPDEPGLATVWRHLAHWPAFLSHVHDGLAPLQDNGTITHCIHQMLAIARTEGQRLAHLKGDVVIKDFPKKIVSQYVQHAGLVVRMVAIGFGLAKWLRDA